jgi:hypothetical protein
MAMPKRCFILLWLTSILLAAEPCPAAQPGDMIWTGDLKVQRISEGPPNLTGVYNTTWTIKLRLKEAGRIDVKDQDGNLIGQLARLMDAGSYWRGVEDGYFVHHGIGKVDEFIYSGQDGGLGLAANNGWIYYSLSDEDPLFDLLPNGSYCFLARSGSAAQFDTTLRHISCDSQGCNEVVRAIPGAAMLIYSVGKLFMGHGGSMPGPIPVDFLENRPAIPPHGRAR